VPKLRLEYLPMRAADVPGIVALERRIYPFPWTEGNFIDSISSGYSAWVCVEGGAVVAYAVMMRVLDEAQILTIGVAAERQRCGIGSALLEHLLRVAKVGGARRMFLEVRLSNLPAHGLYVRYGFAGIGRRAGYYPALNGREDAIVMARDL